MISALVGRSFELSRLDALAAAQAPLVTLWGPGGVGKTRLAREHAARRTRAGGRVAFADLSTARSERDAVATLASALGVSLATGDDPVLVLLRAAAAQDGLLVVADNVEQLSRSARDVIAKIASPRTRVLVTSREPIGAEGEVLVPIEPLPEDEALALFFAVSARTCDRDTARAIVERLDALPLAIELAGARASLLGSKELLSRLDRKLDVVASTTRGLPARHATLRAAIAWSWDLLEEDERAALAACAAFAGPFDAALAEAVIARDDALDLLDRLRARALVHSGAGEAGDRPLLRLAESVRDFARERLGERDDRGRIADAHASAVLARAEPFADRASRGGGGHDELARRRADLVAIAGRGGDLGARATLALAALFAVTGPTDAAIETIDAALASPPSDAALVARLHVARAEALRARGSLQDAYIAIERALAMRAVTPDADRVAGSIARALGRTDEALAHEERALAAYRAAGDEARAGLAVGEIGAVHQSAGRLALARRRHAEAIAIHVANESRLAEGVERSFLAVATHRAGDPAAALPLHERALAVHRETGHRRLEGAELLHIAFVRHELGDAAGARESFRRARETLAAAGARGLESIAQILAARLEIDEGDTTAAMLLLAEAAQVAPTSWPRLRATRRLIEGHLALARGEATAAREAYAASLEASDHVEVGFEALTPAWLALALARCGAPADEVRAAIEAARARVSGHENPHLAAALAVLEAGALGGAPPRIDERSASASSEVRRALARAGARRALAIAEDGRRMVLPDGRDVDLGKRKNVVRILKVLAQERRAHPGVPVTADTLLHAGWPGERMRADAATKRLHTAIWTLRTLGLEGILLTDERGYLLDPSVPVES